MAEQTEDEMQNIVRSFSKLAHQEILVIGSLVTDVSCQYSSLNGNNQTPVSGSSNKAKITQCVGGVAHNIALATSHFDASVLLTSAVGVDDAGDFLIRQLEKEGLKTDGMITLRMYDDGQPVRTGQYIGNYDADKNFLFGMADVGLMEHPLLETQKVWGSLFHNVRPLVTVLDTTFSPVALDIALCHARNCGSVVIVEPVSVPRAMRLIDTLIDFCDFVPKNKIDVCTPNEHELTAMFDQLEAAQCLNKDKWRKMLSSDSPAETSYLNRIRQRIDSVCSDEGTADYLYYAVLLLPIIPTILVTLGKRGCIVATLAPFVDDDQSYREAGFEVIVENKAENVTILVKLFSASEVDPDKIVSVNGAGDSLVGAVATGLAIGRKSFDSKEKFLLNMPFLWPDLVNLGQKAAVYTLQNAATVSPWLRFMRGKFKAFQENLPTESK